MQKIKLIDLYNVKFSEMENNINSELSALEEKWHNIKEVKFLWDQLKNWAVFIVYETK